MPKYFAVVGACYLVATNGMARYACRIELEAGSYVFLNDLPSYEDLLQGKE